MIDAPSLDWWAFAPELVLGGASIAVLLIGLAAAGWARALNAGIALAAFLTAIALAVLQFDSPRIGEWGQQLDADQLANVVRILAGVAGASTVLFAIRGGRPRDGREGEYLALLLAAGCGMGLLGASGSLVALFVGLELFSIALYVLCALEAERPTSLEAGLKYLIVGGLSSAVLLYGAALTYGATGTFDLTAIAEAGADGMLLNAGMAMILVGLAFKVSAAPLHWWTPDVYDGAPTSITAFMATATKAAAFAVIVRVLVVAFPEQAPTWEIAIAALATTSIVVGNLGALVQQQVKRMLAYSSIAQAGYMLIALVGWQATGVPALVYALAVYVAMTMAAFALLHARERQLGRPVTFGDYAGTGWSASAETNWLAALPGLGMVIAMLSLAGLPPTGGFFAKFGLFDAAVAGGYEWLAVVGVLGSVVSLAYYLRVPIAMYMQSPPGSPDGDAPRPFVPSAIGVGFAAVTIALAFMPGYVLGAGCDARNALPGMGGECPERLAGAQR